jgi:DNA-binding phage protein
MKTQHDDELFLAWRRLKAETPDGLTRIAEGSGVPRETLRKLRRQPTPMSTYSTLRRIADAYAHRGQAA